MAVGPGQFDIFGNVLGSPEAKAAESRLSGVAKFFGSTVGEAAAFAAGIAIAPVLAPVLRAEESTVWSSYPNKPIDPGTLAEGVAAGHITEEVGASEAALNGISAARFAELVAFARNGPGVGTALELWRRGLIDDAAVVVALQRAGVEQEWITALTTGGIDGLGMKRRPLDPVVIATAIQRGIMAAPFDLPYSVDVPIGNVTPFPASTLDTKAEAEASGIDEERLRVETALVGLPMALDRAARAHFRGILTDGDYLRAVLEGNARGEWAQAELDVAREILTAHDWAELHLRGYITQDEMYAGTALHGMTQADTDHLFAVLGRPLAIHQITTALARGAKFNPIPGELTDPYEASVHEANLKPAYYEMAIANKYSYPSLFQLNNLVKANAITADVARDWANKQGYAPEVLDAMHKFWAGEQTAPAASPVKGATTRAVNAVGKAYIAGNLNQTDAEAELAKLGEDAATFPALFVVWDVNRQATLQAKTNTQIRNLYRNLGLTEAEALAVLESRGLSATDATAYLTAPVRPPAT